MSPETESPAKVPFLDVRRGDAPYRDELEAAFRRVLGSGQYVLGPEVGALEEQLSAYLGVRHAIGVSSGTDALLLALMTLGIGPGDEVVLPTFTFFATAGSVARVGATPVLCEVDPRTYNLDAGALAGVLTARTKAVMPVHLFGQCADMDAIRALTEPRGIPVIEDAAQAIGASCRGRKAGGLGSLACFSFYPTKNLGAFGDAGLLTTDDDALAERARLLRVHGDRGGYDHALIGANFRLDALQAALLAVKLPHLEAATAARRERAERYGQLFAELDALGRGPEEGTRAIALPEAVFERHVYNQYVVRVRGSGRRDALRQALAAAGVGTAVYYPACLHHQPCFAGLGYAPGAFPAAEQAAREVLALPMFPTLTAAEQRRVVEAVREGLG